MTDFDPRAVPVFITCRDLLTPVEQIVAWLEAAGHERLYLVDNQSTWPPLLEYLESTPHEVVDVGANLGHRAHWEIGLVDRVAGGRDYVVADCDAVPDPSCPPDALAHLYGLLRRYPDYVKAGLGIRIDDLPERYDFADLARRYESKYWRRPLERGVFHAKLDTTFALYRGGVGYEIQPAIRTGAPYVVRHLPWYIDSADPPEEYCYYWDHASMKFSNWGPTEVSDRMARTHRPHPDLYRRFRWWVRRTFMVRRER